MTAQTEKLAGTLDLAGCHHWSDQMPYRAIVAVKEHAPHGTILYQVAGAVEPPCGAQKALKLALKTHGGVCFYCQKAPATEASENLTLDHIEATANGGKDDLANLVIACKPCNYEKGQGSIESFNPRATREWLTALQTQIETRLAKLA